MQKLLAAFVVVLCVSAPGFAQTQCNTYSFFGTLIIPVRDYPPIIEVHLLSYMGEEPIAHTYIDGTNRFRFDGLIPGRIDVVVRQEGFQELREHVDIGTFMSPDGLGCGVRGVYWLLPVEQVDERLRGYPQLALDEYSLAIHDFDNQHYEDAAKHLETVIMLAADWFDAHCDLGVVYEKLNRIADAEKEYRRALELKPDSVRALMDLGRLLLDEVDKKLQTPPLSIDVRPALLEARKLLADAVKGDGKSAMATYLLGGADFRLADFKLSETELKRALDLDATLFPARLVLINVYISQMLWQDALDQSDTFLLQNPSSPLRQQVMATRNSVVRRLQTR